MQKNVPGLDVPDALIKRLEGVDKKDQAKEGIAMCCEQIQEFKEMKGVAGVHIMAIEWEKRVPEIVEKAKLLPRPKIRRGKRTFAKVVQRRPSRLGVQCERPIRRKV